MTADVPDAPVTVPGVPEAGPPPSRRRLAVMAAAGALVMVAVFALLLPQVSSYEEAFAELADIPRGWLLALLAAGVANILVYPLTVLVAVRGLRYRHGFLERQIGFLVSNVVPGGGAFAVGTQYAVLGRYGVSSAAAAAAVSADAVWTYLLTLGLPALGVVLLVVEGRSAAGYTTIALIGVAVVVVSVVAIVMILRSDAGATKVGRWGERRRGPGAATAAPSRPGPRPRARHLPGAGSRAGAGAVGATHGHEPRRPADAVAGPVVRAGRARGDPRPAEPGGDLRGVHDRARPHVVPDHPRRARHRRRRPGGPAQRVRRRGLRRGRRRPGLAAGVVPPAAGRRASAASRSTAWDVGARPTPARGGMAP